MILREIQFGRFGFEPDPSWPLLPVTDYSLGIPFVYFNISGVIFYSDVTRLVVEYSAAKSLGFNAATEGLLGKLSSRSLAFATQRIPALSSLGANEKSARSQSAPAMAILLGTLVPGL